MKRILFLCLIFISGYSFAQKIFKQPDAMGTWQYISPFKDKSYVLAIQYGVKEEQVGENINTTIYFGKIGLKTDQLFWKEKIYAKLITGNVSYEDYNSDGIKDVLIFSETGARGGNAFYYLFLLDPKNKKISKVKNFENIVNPEYNRKHHVVVSYGLSGTNNYSIYKISKANKAYQIGESFEDTFDSDPTELDKRIRKILKKSVH
ncbi:XAC2610-related protein [Pedobacter jeongneungensis]